MLEELRTASSLLDLAITRYLQACSSIQKSCIAGDARVVFPPELLITRLDDETNLLPTYKSRLQDAVIAIGSAKNFSKRASASALPPEILAHIFHYVLAGGRCEGLWDCNPEELSHVCSTWRQAAINSSGLWVHIDLSTSSRLIARTKRYVARSSQLPLYVHILGAIEMDSHKKDENHTSLITSLAPRAKSIHFDQDDGDYEDSTLKTFLENRIPGVLNRITMRLFHDNDVHQFILAQDQEMPRILFGSGTLRLDVSKQHLEGIMLGLTTFRSGGSYPLWDSKAYHSLTDLGLGGLGEIPESQFVAVLSSSPQLSSLEIALKVTRALPIASPVEPIHLVALERLLTRNRYSIDSLLRWIAPGPKPLHLIITYGSHGAAPFTPSLKEQLQMFFLRSNTTRVSVNLQGPDSVLVAFFSAVDSIKELVVGGREVSTNFRSDCPVPEIPLRLDTL